MKEEKNQTQTFQREKFTWIVSNRKNKRKKGAETFATSHFVLLFTDTINLRIESTDTSHSHSASTTQLFQPD